MRVTNSVIEALMDQELGGTTATPPATVYIGLLTDEPDNDGTGFTEVAGGAYDRVAKTNNATNFPVCTSGTRRKENGTVITFPTASGAWGSVVGVGIFYASSGGDCKWYAPLSAPESIGIGNVVAISAASLRFTAL